MSAWNISRINKNRYKVTNNEIFIEVQLSTNFENDPEILLAGTQDMSCEGVIFYPILYPTEDNESPIIGEAYLYEGLKCVNKDLVRAYIVDTNIPDIAKVSIEVLCL